MKKIAIITLLVLGFSGLYAQDYQEDEYKTVFQQKDGHLHISGFGGPMMSFGTIDGNFAHMMGGGGGVIVNNFFFGGYGMGLTTPPNFMEFDQGRKTETDEKLAYGHGGIWTGFIIGSNRAIHFSISSQFGWGQIGKIDQLGDDGDLVFVITPIAEVEMNFSRYFKIGIGSSASLVNGFDHQSAYEQADFLNPNIFLSFKFGWFD